MILSIIVAYAEDREGRYIIGKDNSIPWYLPHDLARFQEHTMSTAVIMGRKTFESIGRVLTQRENIIITRQENYEVSGASVFNNLQEALDFVAPRHSEVFIIGGQELYEQTLDKVDRMYITYVDAPDVEGDTFFPKWKRIFFKVIQSETKDGRTEFEILQRLSKAKEKTASVEDVVSNMYGQGYII